MTVTASRIQRNLDTIREQIAEHCQRARRDPEEVTIVAVVKSVEFDTIKNLLDVGITELAESRVQQLSLRVQEMATYLRRRQNPLPSPVRWHMVGHVQRNKSRAACEAADVMHSIDSLRLAEDADRRAEQVGKILDVMLQVNCSEETQKSGCAVGAAFHLGEMISSLKNLRLVGLMTMASESKDLNEARHSFSRLREIFAEMRSDKIGGDAFRHLSMGMSNDYTVAVEEGATMLRIGTALFE